LLHQRSFVESIGRFPKAQYSLSQKELIAHSQAIKLSHSTQSQIGDNDAGWIRLPDGRVLIIAVYNRNTATFAEKEMVIAQIARAAYDWALFASEGTIAQPLEGTLPNTVMNAVTRVAH